MVEESSLSLRKAFCSALYPNLSRAGLGPPPEGLCRCERFLPFRFTSHASDHPRRRRGYRVEASRFLHPMSCKERYAWQIST
jgi:hypothetical protein